jgi:hypothetical protein
MAQTASPISCPSLGQDLVIRRGKPNALATASVSFDNASETASATFIAFYLLGSGESRLIQMLDR